MSVFDEESLLIGVRDIVINNINAKLAEIDADKNDGITLEQLDSNVFITNLNVDVSNYDPFVYYGLANSTATGIGPATAREVTLFFEVITQLNYFSDFEATSRILRYIRALKEVVEENFKKLSAASILEITTLPPVDLRDNEEAFWKVGGIELTASIA